MKQRIVYVCTRCGASTRQWRGQCPDCGVWNTLEEGVENRSASRPRVPLVQPIAASNVDLAPDVRVETKSPELDRVLGGGLVAGAIVLVGGEPGIGKSTLLLQVLGNLSDTVPGVLYVTGEESIHQVALRAQRLGVAADSVRLLAETRVESILEVLERENPRIVVIDSIQTMFTEALQSAPGQRRSGARERGVSRTTCKEPCGIGAAGGSRHQGWGDRRSPGARTHGGHRAVFRK